MQDSTLYDGQPSGRLSEESNGDEADTTIKDCLAARAAAIEEDEKVPNAGVYIPQCAPNGLYEEVQCHQPM